MLNLRLWAALLVLRLPRLAGGENFEGRVSIRPKGWLLVAYFTGDSLGEATVSLQVLPEKRELRRRRQVQAGGGKSDAAVKFEYEPVDAGRVDELKLSLLVYESRCRGEGVNTSLRCGDGRVFASKDWLGVARKCDELPSRDKLHAVRYSDTLSWMGDALNTTLTLSQQDSPRQLFVILSACESTAAIREDMPNATGKKQPAEKPVQVRWQYKAVSSGNQLPADISLVVGVMALLPLVLLPVVLWLVSDPSNCETECLWYVSVLEAGVALSSGLQLREVYATGEPMFGLLFITRFVDLVIEVAISYIAIVEAGRKVNVCPVACDGDEAMGAHCFAFFYASFQLGMKAYLEPWASDGSLHLYMERIRVSAQPPWDQTALIALLCWLHLLYTAFKERRLCLNVKGVASLTLALLGRPALRLVCMMWPTYERPMAGSFLSLALTIATYSLLLWGTFRMNNLVFCRKLLHQVTVLDGEFGAPLRRHQKAVLNGVPLAAGLFMGTFLVFRFAALESHMGNLDKTFTERLQRVSTRLDAQLDSSSLETGRLLTELQERNAAEERSLAYSQQRAMAGQGPLPSVRRYETSRGALPGGPTAAIPLANDTEPGATSPLFLSIRDISTYRYAGMMSPCLQTEPGYPHPVRRMYGSCAVVGAAPSVKGSGAGKEIDALETVFRAGLCQSKDLTKYKADIGTKINFCVSFWGRKDMNFTRMVHPLKSWKWLLEKQASILKQDWRTCPRSMLVVHPETTMRWDRKVAEWANQSPFPEKSIEFWRNKSIFLDPRCSRDDGWKPTKELTKEGCTRIVNLSSGFIAVLLAMDLCKKVKVFGFDLNTSMTFGYQHLNGGKVEENRTAVQDHPHAFPLERHLLSLWNASGLLRLHPSTLVNNNKKVVPSARQRFSARAPPKAPPFSSNAARRSPAPARNPRLQRQQPPASRTPAKLM